jgi:PKD repeat protein
MGLVYKIYISSMVVAMLLLAGCTQIEQPDGSGGDTYLAVGTLKLQITDKPAELDILYANVTISTIQVHKADADVVDKQEEEPYENIDEYNDSFIANGYGPYTGEIGVDIQFLGSATGGNESYNWTWDFGDGAESHVQNATHNYSANGTYTVNLTVIDDNGTGVRDWYITTATIGTEEDESEAGWYTIINTSQTFDLIALQNVTDLLGQENLTAGKYTQIRLTVESAIIIINTSDGNTEEHVLTIPSNKVKLIKPFWIYENETTTLTLDFDIHESVHKTGNNKYMMKPTIKVIQN